MDLKQFILPGIVFLIGAAFSIVGVLFKLLHWGLGPINPPLLITISAVLKLVAIVMAIVILLRIRKTS